MSSVPTAHPIRRLITQMTPQMGSVLPKHMSADRFALTAVIALNKTKDLGDCTAESWKVALMTSAELGLDCSGTTGMAYLVPFNVNVGSRDQPRWEKQVTLIPGYRGLMDLARRTGEVKHMQALTVYERDTFEVYQGSDNHRIVHMPHIGEDRGSVVAFYSVAWLANGVVSTDWMTKGDVDKIRAKSKAKDAMAWTSSYNEMGKKTVVRRHCKYLPTSAELSRAIALDDEAEKRIREVQHEPKPAPRASSQAKLADRLGLAPTEDIDPDTGEIVPPPSETLPGMDNDDPKWDEVDGH